MPRPQGTTKTGGRTKGTPNKRTLDLQENLAASGIDVIEQLTNLLPELPPQLRANVLLELMQYLYPKRKAIEVKTEETPRTKEAIKWGPEDICEALFLARNRNMNEPIPTNWRDVYYSLRVDGNTKSGLDIFWDVWQACRRTNDPVT